MARRSKRARRPVAVRHGAAVGAPDELGFVSGESPAPAPVRARVPQGQPPPRGVPRQPPGRVFRALWALTKVSAGVVVVVGASLALAWAAHRFAMTTPRFAITEIEVRGNGRWSDDHLAKAAGVERGVNIFTVDPARVEQTLVADPWIAEAKVTRKLPGRVEIDVVEHQALALAVLGDGLFLVTRAGLPFKRFEPGDPVDLPVLTGLGVDEIATDRQRALERLRGGAEVLRHYERTELARVHAAQEVHLEPDGAAVLSVGAQGLALHLGRAPWARAIAMAERALARVRAAGPAPGLVFLDNEAHPERVVVRMR